MQILHETVTLNPNPMESSIAYLIGTIRCSSASIINESVQIVIFVQQSSREYFEKTPPTFHSSSSLL